MTGQTFKCDYRVTYKNMNYSIKKQVDRSFADTVTRTKSVLAESGFGILTEIDVKATLKHKLNVEWDNYVILGACNPPFAFEALTTEKEIGLLLPCNVIVYEHEGNTFVSAIRPTVAMAMVTNATLGELAEKVEKNLQEVIDNI